MGVLSFFVSKRPFCAEKCFRDFLADSSPCTFHCQSQKLATLCSTSDHEVHEIHFCSSRWKVATRTRVVRECTSAAPAGKSNYSQHSWKSQLCSNKLVHDMHFRSFSWQVAPVQYHVSTRNARGQRQLEVTTFKYQARTLNSAALRKYLPLRFRGSFAKITRRATN